MNARVQSTGRVQAVLLASALGGLLAASALVWTRTEILSLQYELATLVEREAAFRAEVEKLEVEVAVLAAPARIEGRARALGLRFPDPGQVVRDVAARGVTR